MQEGKIKNPPRTVIEFPDYEGSALYMPSADFSLETTATKVVTIFPHNPKQGQPTTQGVLLLSDASNGEHVCLMGASYLTRLRTGALSAIGTNKLARKNSKVLGVIGTGGMAFEQVLGVLEVRPTIETILLFNRTKEKAEQFKNRLEEFGISKEIIVQSKVDELVGKSDIINCATRSNDPVFKGELLKDGTHINGVGSYLPYMREVDLTTIKKCSKIVVDDMHGAMEEAGELIYAAEVTDWDFSQLYGELKSVSMDDELIRSTDEEITFFKSVGAAYFDLIVANGTYQKAKALDIGEKVKI